MTNSQKNNKVVFAKKYIFYYKVIH